MKQSKYAQDWFDEKYGESVKPFHAEIIMNQQPSTKINSTNQLDFNYFYKTGSGIKERSPSRFLDIKDPAKYDGFMGRHQKSES
jgi:hypothetical protein